MQWSDVERRQPRLAGIGRQRLLDPGVVLVATIRRDGTPRLSPVEPFLMEGDLWLSMLWQSTKAADLVRDPRVLYHVSYLRYDDATGDQFVIQWPPGREYVRRGTTPTSLGQPEPLADVLLPD